MQLVRPGRTACVVTLSLSIFAAGCQTASHRGAPAQADFAQPASAKLDKTIDATPAGNSQGPFFNPNYRDDEERLNPVFGFFAAAGAGVAGVFSAIVRIPVSGLKWLGGDRPGNAARMMEDRVSADNRRQGINKLLEYDFTRRDPYTTRYRQIAANDSDATVRAAAIRASNRARDSAATAVFIRGLADPSDWVRLEAAKALANVPDTAAAPALLRLLTNTDESRDVRIAAADALKHDRTLTVARALAAVLNDRDFGVAWQARKSLKYLFSRDLGYSDSAWLAYLSGPDSPVK